MPGTLPLDSARGAAPWPRWGCPWTRRTFSNPGENPGVCIWRTNTYGVKVSNGVATFRHRFKVRESYIIILPCPSLVLLRQVVFDKIDHVSRMGVTSLTTATWMDGNAPHKWLFTKVSTVGLFLQSWIQQDEIRQTNEIKYYRNCTIHDELAVSSPNNRALYCANNVLRP